MMTLNSDEVVPVRNISGAVFEVYCVRGECDTNEGKGGTYLIGYFHSKSDADDAAKGKGVFGSPGSINKIEVFSADGGKTGVPFTLSQENYKLVPPNFAEKKRKALAKLSPDERRMLGLE